MVSTNTMRVFGRTAAATCVTSVASTKLRDQRSSNRRHAGGDTGSRAGFFEKIDLGFQRRARRIALSCIDVARLVTLEDGSQVTRGTLRIGGSSVHRLVHGAVFGASDEI